MTNLDQIASRIIKEQEGIIGPIAWDEARKVAGLKVLDLSAGSVTIENPDAKTVIDQLVSQYENIFGRASREVCREAVAALIADMSPQEVPSSLQ